MQHSKGLRYSAILHGGMILLMIFGLPSFLEHKPDPVPMVITTEIIPIAAISNVKPQEKPPEKIEPKKPVEEEKTAPKAVTETKQEEPKKPELVPLPPPEPIKPEPKPPEPKKPEPPKEKPKPKEDDLDSILKSVKATAKAQESKKPTEQKIVPNQPKAISDRYDSSMPLSMSETDAIRQQFEQCWSVPAGAKDAQNLVITLNVEVQEDGTVMKVELAKDKGRYNSDTFFQGAADSAMRAVRQCSPLKNLPKGKYSTWGSMVLTFDPSKMLY